MLDRSQYPRVTTVLHEGFAGGGLETWAVKEAFKKYCRLWDDHVGSTGETPDRDAIIKEAKGASREIMTVAARRGTAVHKMIEGKEDVHPLEEDMVSVVNGHQSFVKWAKERDFKPIYHEVPIWSDKHGFKGTLDCIGWVDGRLEIIDWKTSNAIRPEYRLQTAAYWYGFKEAYAEDEFIFLTDGMNAVSTKTKNLFNSDSEWSLKGIRIVRFGGRSDKESQVKDLVEYEELIIDGEEEIAVDFNAFLAAKRIHDWKLKRK